jgi:hypothetical protein
MSNKQPDPLERAEECAHAMLLATDVQQKEALSLLRDLWLTLADQIAAHPEPQFTEELLRLETIHVVTLGLGKTMTH